jgi:hypothetical protein
MSEAVGVIVAAIIAGWVAFFSLIISKEHSVSQFRQQWIDELRKDIAVVVACVSGIHAASLAQRTYLDPLWANVKTDLTRFDEAVARIRLRLNPEEKRKKERLATKAVLGALEMLESIFADSEPQFHQLPALVTTLVTNSQVILKENWTRVRSGEFIYRVTKWGTLAFAVLAVLALVAWLLYVLKGSQWLFHAAKVIF